MKIYTGIGSRETPEDMLRTMNMIGHGLALEGWTLRSGHADGADTAFEKGALRGPGKKEIYLPWCGFNHAPRDNPSYIDSSALPSDIVMQARQIASQFHPAWHRCSSGARSLHTRNVFQILGADLSTRTDLVICWTLGGKRSGGTGQALRLAEYLKIPIFDLAICSLDEIETFINSKYP